MENREEIIKQVDSILKRVEAIDKERIALMHELKNIFPIKEGDKVSLENSETKEHVRFAFVNSISIKLRGNKEKAKIEFDLQKCKMDGTIGQHSDWLKVNEYITKIK